MGLIVDHLFCLVDPDGDWAARAHAAGWVLDEGIAHRGQGTRNRRLWFADQYLEFLWIDAPDDARQNPLRLDRRAGGGCPFGICLRGRLAEEERAQFWPYHPPYAPEATIWIHRGGDELPFVFAFESDRRPIDRLGDALHLLQHARPAAMRSVELSLPGGAAQPLLGDVTPPIRVRNGRPHLEVTVGDGDGVALTDRLTLRG